MEASFLDLLKDACFEKNDSSRILMISKCLKKITDFLPFEDKNVALINNTDAFKQLLLLNISFGQSIHLVIKRLIRVFQNEIKFLESFWNAMHYIMKLPDQNGKLISFERQKLLQEERMNKQHGLSKESKRAHASQDSANMHNIKELKKGSGNKQSPSKNVSNSTAHDEEYFKLTEDDFCDAIKDNVVQMKLAALNYMSPVLKSILKGHREINARVDVMQTFLDIFNCAENQQIIIQGCNLYEQLRANWITLFMNNPIDFEIEDIILQKVNAENERQNSLHNLISEGSQHTLSDKSARKERNRERNKALGQKKAVYFDRWKRMEKRKMKMKQLQKQLNGNIPDNINNHPAISDFKLSSYQSQQEREQALNYNNDMLDEEFKALLSSSSDGENNEADDQSTGSKSWANKEKTYEQMLNIDEFLVSAGHKIPLINMREYMNQFLKSLENYEKFLNLVLQPMQFPATQFLKEAIINDENYDINLCYETLKQKFIFTQCVFLQLNGNSNNNNNGQNSEMDLKIDQIQQQQLIQSSLEKTHDLLYEFCSAHNMRSYKVMAVLCDNRNFRYVVKNNPMIIDQFFSGLYASLRNQANSFIVNPNHMIHVAEFMLMNDKDRSFVGLIKYNLLFMLMYFIDFDKVQAFILQLLTELPPAYALQSSANLYKTWRYLHLTEYFCDLAGLMLYTDICLMTSFKCNKEYKPVLVRRLIENQYEQHNQMQISLQTDTSQPQNRVTCFPLFEELQGYNCDIDQLEMILKELSKKKLLAQSLKKHQSLKRSSLNEDEEARRIRILVEKTRNQAIVYKNQQIVKQLLLHPAASKPQQSSFKKSRNPYCSPQLGQDYAPSPLMRKRKKEKEEKEEFKLSGLNQDEIDEFDSSVVQNDNNEISQFSIMSPPSQVHSALLQNAKLCRQNSSLPVPPLVKQRSLTEIEMKRNQSDEKLDLLITHNSKQTLHLIKQEKREIAVENEQNRIQKEIELLHEKNLKLQLTGELEREQGTKVPALKKYVPNVLKIESKRSQIQNMMEQSPLLRKHKRNVTTPQSLFMNSKNNAFVEQKRAFQNEMKNSHQKIQRLQSNIQMQKENVGGQPGQSQSQNSHRSSTSKPTLRDNNDAQMLITEVVPNSNYQPLQLPLKKQNAGPIILKTVAELQQMVAQKRAQQLRTKNALQQSLSLQLQKNDTNQNEKRAKFQYAKDDDNAKNDVKEEAKNEIKETFPSDQAKNGDTKKKETPEIQSSAIAIVQQAEGKQSQQQQVIQAQSDVLVAGKPMSQQSIVNVSADPASLSMTMSNKIASSRKDMQQTTNSNSNKKTNQPPPELINIGLSLIPNDEFQIYTEQQTLEKQALINELYPCEQKFIFESPLERVAKQPMFTALHILQTDQLAANIADVFLQLFQQCFDSLSNSKIGKLINAPQLRLEQQMLYAMLEPQDCVVFELLLRTYLFKIRVTQNVERSSAVACGQIVNLLLSKLYGMEGKLEPFSKHIIRIAMSHLPFLQKVMIHSYGWDDREVSLQECRVGHGMGVGRLLLAETFLLILQANFHFLRLQAQESAIRNAAIEEEERQKKLKSKIPPSQQSGKIESQASQKDNSAKIKQKFLDSIQLTLWDVLLKWLVKYNTNNMYQNTFLKTLSLILQEGRELFWRTLLFKVNYAGELIQVFFNAFPNGAVIKQKLQESLYLSVKRFFQIMIESLAEKAPSFESVVDQLFLMVRWQQLVKCAYTYDPLSKMGNFLNREASRIQIRVNAEQELRIKRNQLQNVQAENKAVVQPQKDDRAKSVKQATGTGSGSRPDSKSEAGRSQQIRATSTLPQIREREPRPIKSVNFKNKSIK